jgi:hypothetical protein
MNMAQPATGAAHPDVLEPSAVAQRHRTDLFDLAGARTAAFGAHRRRQTVEVQKLGGRWPEPGTINQREGFELRGMADPEGNEFDIEAAWIGPGRRSTRY